MLDSAGGQSEHEVAVVELLGQTGAKRAMRGHRVSDDLVREGV